MNKINELATFEAAIYQNLSDKYGELIGGKGLWKMLGYPSAEAFRQAYIRNVVPVHVFYIPNRRGKFALVRDVTAWLVKLNSNG